MAKQSEITAISPELLYPLQSLSQLGFGERAQRTARQRGLEVKYISTRGFVHGKALIDYVLKHGKSEHAGG